MDGLFEEKKTTFFVLFPDSLLPLFLFFCYHSVVLPVSQGCDLFITYLTVLGLLLQDFIVVARQGWQYRLSFSLHLLVVSLETVSAKCHPHSICGFLLRL